MKLLLSVNRVPFVYAAFAQETMSNPGVQTRAKAMKVLSLNAGSNSLKFEIVEVNTDGWNTTKEPPVSQFGQTIVSGSYDNIGKDGGCFSLFEGKRSVHSEDVELQDYAAGAKLLSDWIESGGARSQGVASLSDIDRIGHRVVHGADLFQQPARINEDVLHQIEELEDLAPLHNASALSVIRAAGERAGTKTPMVAVFDTTFHQTIPDPAALYALPLELARRHKVRRYGFHGISHQYLTWRYAEIAGKPRDEVSLVTLHLEGGSSAAAIRNGRSVDTSMGFTPLEGLMMGTRCGDMDPAIVPYLMRKESLDTKAVEELLNKKCGLLGVSGLNADTRVLRKQTDKAEVRLALDMFSYRVRKYVGAYVAALGGIGAVVFGGGIGENTAEVRHEVCNGLECMGIQLDPELNRTTIDCEGRISRLNSPVQIWVIPTREALMVAYHTARASLAQ